MAKLKFKRFSDLAFLQGIDKPRYLSPLLSSFSDYFSRQGLDISSLTNSDATERKLLEIFTKPDEEMQGPLLEMLYVLDDLADESGHDRIAMEIERSGEIVEGLGDDMTPGEYAIVVYQAKPGLIQACHEKTFYRKIKNYTAFQSRNGSRLTFPAVQKGKTGLEESLAVWFGKMDRGKVCEIYAYEEGPEIRFVVTHGVTYRSQGTIDKNLRKTRVAFRPQKHDSVIYDTRTGVLKVNAQVSQEKEEYRKQFGQIYFGSEDQFPPGDIYTLSSMQREGFRLRVPDGIDWADLCEIWIQSDDDHHILQITRGYDLLKSAREKALPNLAKGQIVRAAFKVKYRSGGKPRRLEVRPTNIAIYDHDRDCVASEAFLKINEFLKAEPECATTALT